MLHSQREREDRQHEEQHAGTCARCRARTDAHQQSCPRCAAPFTGAGRFDRIEGEGPSATFRLLFAN